MPAIVVDTNVAIVANGGHPGADKACVASCINELRTLVKQGQIAIDDGWRIIREYRAYLSEAGQPGVGDVFFKWLLQNYQNRKRCIKVALQDVDDEDRVFAEFPNHPGFAGFDRGDRKFVAVANGLPVKPPILQAVDIVNWKRHEQAFVACGITVKYLCEHLAAAP